MDNNNKKFNALLLLGFLGLIGFYGFTRDNMGEFKFTYFLAFSFFQFFFTTQVNKNSKTYNRNNGTAQKIALGLTLISLIILVVVYFLNIFTTDRILAIGFIVVSFLYFVLKAALVYVLEKRDKQTID